MSCRCIDCVYHISRSESIGRTLHLWDVCTESGKTIEYLTLYADRECRNFKPVKP